jgi:hypothetical protein
MLERFTLARCWNVPAKVLETDPLQHRGESLSHPAHAHAAPGCIADVAGIE